MRGLIAACLLLAGGGIAGGMEWRAVSKDLGRARYPMRSLPADGTAPLGALFGGPPVARAVAADALGRAPLLEEGARARLVGALLEVMVADGYPAVRYLAWRGVRRLMAPGAPVGSGFSADFDPSGSADDRRRTVERLRASLGTAEVPPPGWLTARRGRSPDRDLEIGE